MGYLSLDEKVLEFFGDDVVALHSSGIASILLFKHDSGSMLKLVEVEKEDDDSVSNAITVVASQIRKECLQMKKERTNYSLCFDKKIADESVSSTLSELIYKISPKFQKSPLVPTLIGNIITSTVCSQSTDLQIALGVMLNRHKDLIVEFSKYKVTCSYDEVLRFKHSAAICACKEYSHGLTFKNVDGVIHIVVDNFDTEVHSQYCKLVCHVLAMMAGQASTSQTSKMLTIPRISKEAMSHPIPYDQPLEPYVGSKHPPMPPPYALHQVPRLDLLCKKVVTTQRALESDFDFLKKVITTPSCPEYNGYMTKKAREAGVSPEAAINRHYLPLINHTPSDPSTILTAMSKAMTISRNAGQITLPFTADMQLYQIDVSIIFNDPNRFKDVVPILGGMHFLECYISSIGTLGGPLGLHVLMSGAFGSVDSMLNGKKLPQNVRALRLVIEELLWPIFESNSGDAPPPPGSMPELINKLSELSKKSRTTKAWVDNVIRPVLLINMFCRAAHEGDFALHVSSAEMMIPLMFAAGRPNYSRYGTLYVEWMHSLPYDLHKAFMKGQLFVHLMAGIFNGIWTDQFIECTWMRHGHGPSGVIGMATDENQMKIWSLSMGACSELVSRLKMMGGIRGKSENDAQGRITS